MSNSKNYRKFGFVDAQPSRREDGLSRVEYARLLIDKDRRLNPHRYVQSVDGLGANYLFVENVAAMLGCSTDFVRRIARTELPASKVGARVIYARTDVEAFILARRNSGNGRHILDRGAQKLKPSAPVSLTSSVIDPVKRVRDLLRGAE